MSKREREKLLRSAERTLAKRHLLDFQQFTWPYPHPFLVGRHTREITERLTSAVNDFRQGKSSYLLIQVPYRHGKSDIVSRALPPWFLGSCIDMDPNLIATSYGAGVAEGFSKDVKRIIRSPECKGVFPKLDIETGSDNVAEWSVKGSTGRANFAGLGGSVVGKGAHLLLVDDYCKSRAEARSKVVRDKTWDAFRIDLMSRLAPVHIVCITATPWHIDDMAGRVLSQMEEDPHFPQFEVIRFPARNEDGSYLFPEMYPDDWYEAQYALQGSLSSANLDCSPTLEGGGRFAVDCVKIHDSLDDFPAVRYARGWDLASTAVQRDSNDPDYTVGARVGVTMEGGVPQVWIPDVRYFREDSPERNRRILKTMEEDGPGVIQVMEAYGAYKDAFNDMRTLLNGRRSVKASRLPGDKGVKLSPLEVIFESGNVHILRAPWNNIFLSQFGDFPDGAYDDIPDAVGVAYNHLNPTLGGARIISRK